jgi:putative ABC transport system permease protein
MGLTMAAGQNFSGTNSSDSNYILVNEALVREYGWKDPLGQRLPGKYTQRVLGVVKDFNFESLHTTVKPLVMAIKPDSIFRQSSDVSMAYAAQPRISIRFRPGNLKQHMEQLQKTWKTVAGDQDFEFRFLDDALNAAYEQEQRLGNIVRYASFLSIFIACMGLFGLATLVVVRRTKEIGIRKVLGADIGRIVFLVAKDFVLLVLVASVIAFPIAWWALHRWLEDFAYRTRIPVWIFGAAAVIALLIAICTVGVQAIRAARANPVKSLRME